MANRLTAALLLLVIAALPALAASGAGKLTRLTIVTDAGAHVFHVEEAVTAEERATGLMNRKAMAPDHGMLFRFPRTMAVTMWMKDTLIPLDMIFIREDGTIAGISARAKPLSEAIIPSPEPVRFVLELNGGTAARIDAQPGDRVSTARLDDDAGK